MVYSPVDDITDGLLLVRLQDAITLSVLVVSMPPESVVVVDQDLDADYSTMLH